MKGVAYGAFTPVLLQAIKEIQTEILGFAQSITSAVGNFGSVHSDIGITTKDKVTGDYYCLYVLSGVMSSAKGTCEEINGTSTPSSLPAQASISNPDSAVSSSTLDTNSTSTPDLEVSSPSNDTSTSTTPNLEASPLSE